MVDDERLVRLGPAKLLKRPRRRRHRSTIINLDLVERVVTQNGNWQVSLRGWPEPFVVSRRYTGALKSRLDVLQLT